MSPRPRQLAERFAAYYTPEPNTGCWLWTGALKSVRPTRRELVGYGLLRLGPKTKSMIRAHRASWLIHHGAIPPGMFVCHRCDMPACVNPEHLFLGTPADNSADMTKKGRGFVGVRLVGPENPRAKLSESERQRLVAECEVRTPQLDIARRFKVSQSLVSKIYRAAKEGA